MTVRVVLVDDQALVRVGIKALAESEPDLQVVGEAADGRAAVRVVKEVHQDVVVMDIRMPGLDGLEATKIIAADPDLKQVKVLILTTFELDEYVFEALRAGAGGFLLKDADPSELLRAIRVIAAGEALLSPGVTRRIVEAFVAKPISHSPQTSLLAHLPTPPPHLVALPALSLPNPQIPTPLF